MTDEMYRRILAHADDYLERDPVSLEAPDRAKYLADIRALLEVGVEAVERGIGHEREGVAHSDDGDTTGEQATRTIAVVPPRVLRDMPISRMQKQWVRRREIVHETLVETGWNQSETSRRLGVAQCTVSALVSKYWPEHNQKSRVKENRKRLLEVLMETRWNRTEARKVLGLSRKALNNKIHRYGLRGAEMEAKRVEENPRRSGGMCGSGS